MGKVEGDVHGKIGSKKLTKLIEQNYQIVTKVWSTL